MKKMICFMLSIAMAAAMAACSGGAPTPASSGSASGPAAEVTTLKYNFVKTSTDPTYASWERFAKEIEEKSEGTLKIEMYSGESLGKTVDVIESLTKGAPILADCDPSFLTDFVPDYGIYMYPYLLSKPSDVDYLWKSDFGKELDQKLEEKGLKMVVNSYFGTRNLITSKPVKSRDDIKNLKIRVANTKMFNATVASVLGGNVTNTPWSETYMALSQGVADGAEPPYFLMYSAKLYEPCKYVAETAHIITGTTVVMSKAVYDGLPDIAKEAIDEVSHTYPKEVMLDEFLNNEKEFKQKLIDAGVTITEVDKAPFMEAADQLVSQFPEFTPGAIDRVKTILKDNKE